MVTSTGSTVHPWYKGNHEWKVKGVAQLEQPIKYKDEQQGEVKYDPKIMRLEAPTGCPVLWFNYWISTDKTGGKMKWGGGPPVLEEYVFLELMKKAIKNGLLSDDFINALQKEFTDRRGAITKGI
jgi:hypothetical protein